MVVMTAKVQKPKLIAVVCLIAAIVCIALVVLSGKDSLLCARHVELVAYTDNNSLHLRVGSCYKLCYSSGCEEER